MSDTQNKQEPRRVSDLNDEDVEEVAAFVVEQCNGGTPFEFAVLLARERFHLVG